MTSEGEEGFDVVEFQTATPPPTSTATSLFHCLAKKYKCMIMLILLLLATAELLSSILLKMDTTTFDNLLHKFLNQTSLVNNSDIQIFARVQ